VVGLADTSTPPPGTPDSARADSVPVPSDSTQPPPDTTGPTTPAGAGFHVGIPFGPAHLPPDRFAEFSGTIYTATDPGQLLADLELARKAGTRLLISFTGNEQFLRDQNGFSFAMWKQRVDRFLGVDLTPYIDDGTIIAHFILDEPSDRTNWNGQRVSQDDIEAMAAYSKQVWSTMPTMIRARTDYLAGHGYPHLDAVRVQYLHRLGPITDFLKENVEAAKSLGLELVGGLNVINGGSPTSGISGRTEGMHAMSADEIRSWGITFLSEPDLCAFMLYEYDSTYFSRPDIQAALSELSQKARTLPNRACRP
jgi:hypothetical protein